MDLKEIQASVEAQLQGTPYRVVRVRQAVNDPEIIIRLAAPLSIKPTLAGVRAACAELLAKTWCPRLLRVDLAPPMLKPSSEPEEPKETPTEKHYLLTYTAR